MDPKSLPKKEPRKVRFAPKAPPKREQKVVAPKVEEVENDIDVAKQELLQRRFNESKLGGKQKFERKVEPVKVAFGYGGVSSTIRSYGSHKGIKKNQDGVGESVEKEYNEPWDYNTYYPTTVPLRRPYSGNPELLNKEEFGEDPQVSAYDECATNAAEELGLLDPESNMFFFQLPKNMPSINPSADTQVNEAGQNVGKCKGTGVSGKPCNIESLPSGLMGKMLIYKSGAVKLKLGISRFGLCVCSRYCRRQYRRENFLQFGGAQQTCGCNPRRRQHVRFYVIMTVSLVSEILLSLEN